MICERAVFSLSERHVEIQQYIDVYNIGMYQEEVLVSAQNVSDICIHPNVILKQINSEKGPFQQNVREEFKYVKQVAAVN